MKYRFSFQSQLRFLVFFLMFFAGGAYAKTMQEFVFRPDTVYTINTGIGIATQIEISPREQVKDYGTGFSSAWELARRDNVFYLKPKDLDADTNMYIRTNKRTYLLDLRVVSKQWRSLNHAKNIGVNYHVRFSYPNENFENNIASGQDASSKDSATPRKPHWNYDFSAAKGSDWLVPRKIHDDGKFTYIDLQTVNVPSGGIPAVYGKKSDDGNEFIVNSKTEGGRITVFGIYNNLVLRHGDSVVGLRRNPS